MIVLQYDCVTGKTTYIEVPDPEPLPDPEPTDEIGPDEALQIIMGGTT